MRLLFEPWHPPADRLGWVASGIKISMRRKLSAGEHRAEEVFVLFISIGACALFGFTHREKFRDSFDILMYLSSALGFPNAVLALIIDE